MKLIVRLNSQNLAESGRPVGKMIIVWILAICVMHETAHAQLLKISLEEAQQKARSHYPMSRGKELLDKTEAISIANLAKGYLPQFSFSGQASYQSDVTMVNIPLPGISISPTDKDHIDSLQI